jgi:cAMP-dependent protein kinase regulator
VVEVMKYKRGDYFGERALLKSEPRAANIIVKSLTCKVVRLDRRTFKRLLGPLTHILMRNMDAYLKFN